ncbi:amino acid adenylation domain-containing protein [Cohnella faecalis]|uniref:Amino acid adenylation domain-containing protein n=1 Tax=Cohnella faecalis TaxID=2315694 RepID=A0A398CUN6_9BACL|nr:non-ribosomal peptide synthetase [Cohnella faecalis]RIE04969.1 amino acid adenylation domain-containing protein [Cohnella faecalis]
MICYSSNREEVFVLDQYAVNVLLSSGELDEEKEYWLSKLKDETTKTEMPPDYPLGKYSDYQKGSVTSFMPYELTSKINKLSNHSDLGAYIVMLSAVMYVLHRYTGSRYVVTGTAVLKPQIPEPDVPINRLLPLRCNAGDSPDFRHWLKEVQNTLAEAGNNQRFPLDHIWRTLYPNENEAKPEFYHTAVVMESLHDQSFLDDEVPLNQVFCFFKEGSDIGLTIHFNANLYAADSMKRFVSHFANFLNAAIDTPEQPLSDIEILSVEEKKQLLFDFNDTRVEYSAHKKVHQLFEDSVRMSPNRVALLMDSDTSITYAELNRKSNQLAGKLRHLGVTEGSFVAISMDRSFEMIISLLAILKAGGIYVPVDESAPLSRTNRIFLRLGIRHVLIGNSQNGWIKQISHELPELDCVLQVSLYSNPICEAVDNCVSLCTNDQLIAYSDEDLQVELSRHPYAYVIFTSGSTGEPKGVLVEHGPIVNLIEWVNHTFEVSEKDRLFFITSLSFDLSVYDIFGILAAGGSIRIATNEELANPYAMFEALCTESITFWDSAPAALQQVLSYSLEDRTGPSLRLVFLSGDWIPMTVPGTVKAIFPHARVISLGGATEATIWSNYFPIDSMDARWTSIPYGKPIQNAQYYILGDQFQPSPIGVPGKLYIGGVCLASGYIGDPELTNAKFKANPFIENQRIYDTGDLARWLPDGNMEFLGRVDHQVKIRGYRIELGEIQIQLAKFPSIQSAVVIDREDQTGTKHLCAYFVSEDRISSFVLRRYLTDLLPGYMIPSYFLQVDQMPVTSNGKLDRKALPVPEGGVESDCEYEAPGDELESMLAEIYGEVLGISRVGVNDNFVQLGGHSLKATTLVNQIQKKLNVQIPLWKVFDSPTIRELANSIREMK